jgi:hypothetical protein
VGPEGGGVGVSNPDAFAAGLRSSNDLYTAEGDLQRVGQQAAAGGIGLPFYGRGTDGHFEGPVVDSEDCVPWGPRLDENGKEDISPPAVKI